MELLAVNLASTPRRATLAGRQYLVSPVTLIVPGVLHGSQGPLYYPQDEIQRNVQAWNGMPLVLEHPKTSAGYVSARTPEVLNGQYLGMLLNVTYRDKLAGEAWFDEERLKTANPSLYARVAAGKPVEMSTGLWTDNEQISGTYNGTSYDAVARNYRPDHLAILPEGRGACSVKDGCGVNVNEGEPMDDEQKRSIWQRLGELVGVNVNAMKMEGGESLPASAYAYVPDPQNPSTWKLRIDDAAHVGGAIAAIGKGFRGQKVDLPAGAMQAVKTKIRAAWLKFHKDMTEGDVPPILRNEENAMDEKQKKALVDYIIANCAKCEEKDRSSLNELPDTYLTAWHDDLKSSREKLEAVTNESRKPFKVGEQEFAWNAEKKGWQVKAVESKPDPVTANQEAKPVLTKEQEDDLAFARQVRQERRNEAITAIKANEGNKLTDEQLKAMPLDVLQNMASSFPKTETAGSAHYFGGGGQPTTNARERYPYMPLPGETPVAPKV